MVGPLVHLYLPCVRLCSNDAMMEYSDLLLVFLIRCQNPQRRGTDGTLQSSLRPTSSRSNPCRYLLYPNSFTYDPRNFVHYDRQPPLTISSLLSICSYAPCLHFPACLAPVLPIPFRSYRPMVREPWISSLLSFFTQPTSIAIILIVTHSSHVSCCHG